MNLTNHRTMPFEQRTNPLTPHERAAMSKFLAAYPRPIGLIDWITDAPTELLIGQCELEIRGWLRVRRRRTKLRAIEITGRALRELPMIAEPQGRAQFIAETAASLVPAPKAAPLRPEQVLFASLRIAADPNERDPAQRKASAAIADGLLDLAKDLGFPGVDVDALREAIEFGELDDAQELAEQAMSFIPAEMYALKLQILGAGALADGAEQRH